MLLLCNRTVAFARKIKMRALFSLILPEEISGFMNTLVDDCNRGERVGCIQLRKIV